MLDALERCTYRREWHSTQLDLFRKWMAADEEAVSIERKNREALKL